MSSQQVVGYVPGAWDMFHIGHLNILLRAREYCGRLIAGVVTDEELLRIKGRLPIVPLNERVDLVSSITVVDEVVIDYSTDKINAWKNNRFDVIFKGDDWRGTPKGERLEAQMATVGVRVHYFPYTAHTSSTKLRAMISSR
jgi:glycerol-3-phosphate cytidylyltransferase